MSLACCCAESEGTVTSQVGNDSSCWSHVGMLLHPAFSIPAIVIQGNFIMLFPRSLSLRSVTQTWHYCCGIWSHEMNVALLHFVAYAWTSAELEFVISLNVTTRPFSTLFLLYSESMPQKSGWWIGRGGQHYWPLRSPDLSHLCFYLLGVYEGFAIPADVDTPDALFHIGFAFCSS
jgi:hypothetical protein